MSVYHNAIFLFTLLKYILLYLNDKDTLFNHIWVFFNLFRPSFKGLGNKEIQNW